MNTPNNKIITKAVTRVLKPLVRLLLRNGISYGAFADIAKRVYVEVADSDYTISGKKQTVSRVSILTGLSRKEVKRVQELPDMEETGLDEKYNRAARVISGWIRDKEFQDSEGNPITLPIEGSVSFNALVKKYSGDIPTRAILDELIRVGAIVRRKDDLVSLVTSAYVPGDSAAEKLNILGTDVSELIQTIDFNITHDDESRFQRKVSYDNLPEEVIPEFKRLSALHSQKLLEDLNNWLSRHDRDTNPDSQGTGRYKAGLSIYYVEQDLSDKEDK